MMREFRQAGDVGRGRGTVRAGVGAHRAGGGLSSPRCSAGSAAGRPPVRLQIRLPFASEGDSALSRATRRVRVGYSGGGAGLLRPHLRRPLFPDQRRPTRRAGPRRATVSVRPATPRWSMAAISTMPRPRAASRIPNCRMRSAIATRWSPAAPATARTRSAWRRSRSRMIRRCARATSWPAAAG